MSGCSPPGWRTPASFSTRTGEVLLASKVEALKGVMFQEKLGNLFDKKERVKQLLEAFAPAAGRLEILDQAKPAADLCKADLVTDMVREFPELQGIMARIYALADGEDPEVVARPSSSITGRSRSRAALPGSGRRGRGRSGRQAGYAGRGFCRRADSDGVRRSVRPAPGGGGRPADSGGSKMAA